MAAIFNPAGKSGIVDAKQFDDQQVAHSTSVSAVESQGIPCRVESDRTHGFDSPHNRNPSRSLRTC